MFAIIKSSLSLENLNVQEMLWNNAVEERLIYSEQNKIFGLGPHQFCNCILTRPSLPNNNNKNNDNKSSFLEFIFCIINEGESLEIHCGV